MRQPTQVPNFPIDPAQLPYDETTAAGRGDIDGTQVAMGAAGLVGAGAIAKALHDLSKTNAQVGDWNDFKTSFREHYLSQPITGIDYDDSVARLGHISHVGDMVRDYLGYVPKDEAINRNRAERLISIPGRDGEPPIEQLAPDDNLRHKAGPLKGEPIAPTMPRLGKTRPGLGPEDIADYVNLDKPATAANVMGATAGRMAGDAVNSGVQNLYWALNAVQAIALLGGRAALTRHGGLRTSERRVLERDEETGLVTKKTIRPNTIDQHVMTMAVPTAVAVNAGIGNLTRLPGYAQAAPDPEDPTKTADPLMELVDRHILNRAGDLLPYDKFVQERPDVSLQQYNDYQRYLHQEKGLLGLGLLKGTMDGIHGPEVAIMGKSVPLSTAILPTAGAILGSVLTARSSRAALGRRREEQLNGVAPAPLPGETRAQFNQRMMEKGDRALENGVGGTRLMLENLAGSSLGVAGGLVAGQVADQLL